MEESNNKANKSYIIAIVIGILCLGLIIFAASYSYFSNQITGTPGKINVKTADGVIDISEERINIDEIAPILDSAKGEKAFQNNFNVFLVEGVKTSVCYSLELVVDKIGSNLLNKWFKYELVYGDNEVIEGTFDGKTVGEDGKIVIPLIDNQGLSEGGNNSYTLRLWLSYDENDILQTPILQGDEESRTFEGHLHATGVYGACNNTN